MGLFNYVVEIPLKRLELHKYLDHYKVCYNVHYDEYKFESSNDKIWTLSYAGQNLQRNFLIYKHATGPSFMGLTAPQIINSSLTLVDCQLFHSLEINFFCHFYYDDDVH